MWHVWGTGELLIWFYWEDPSERNHLEALGIEMDLHEVDCIDLS